MRKNAIYDRSTALSSLRFELLGVMLASRHLVPASWILNLGLVTLVNPSLFDWRLSLFAQYLCTLIGKLYRSNYTKLIATTPRLQVGFVAGSMFSVSCQYRFLINPTGQCMGPVFIFRDILL